MEANGSDAVPAWSYATPLNVLSWAASEEDASCFFGAFSVGRKFCGLRATSFDPSTQSKTISSRRRLYEDPPVFEDLDANSGLVRWRSRRRRPMIRVAARARERSGRCMRRIWAAEFTETRFALVSARPPAREALTHRCSESRSADRKSCWLGVLENVSVGCGVLFFR
jgi:hypothetical protein